jgi:hypothetical protein
VSARLAALLSCALLLSAAGTHAQDKHRQPTAAKHPAKSSASKHKAEKSAPAASDSAQSAAPAGKSAHEEVAPTAKSAAPPPVAEADETVHKEGGTEVKTLEFGGLDIEGQLKTPQMLYFLNRLRAEFERPQLPHRSFIPELQRTTKENVF